MYTTQYSFSFSIDKYGTERQIVNSTELSYYNFHRFTIYIKLTLILSKYSLCRIYHSTYKAT